jgi:hypothetical protein
MAPYTLEVQASRVFSFGMAAIMQDLTLIGVHLGTHSFHVHGQDRHGKALLRKKFGRTQLIGFSATFHCCTVVMEQASPCYPK